MKKISVDVPEFVGFEPTGEYRAPDLGEYILIHEGPQLVQIFTLLLRRPVTRYFIYKKVDGRKEKQMNMGAPDGFANTGNIYMNDQPIKCTRDDFTMSKHIFSTVEKKKVILSQGEIEYILTSSNVLIRKDNHETLEKVSCADIWYIPLRFFSDVWNIMGHGIELVKFVEDHYLEMEYRYVSRDGSYDIPRKFYKEV